MGKNHLYGSVMSVMGWLKERTGKAKLRHVLIFGLALSMIASSLWATIGQISTAEKFEELQFIGNITGADPLACVVGADKHVVFKNGRLVTCELLGDGVTYQYVAASARPPVSNVYDWGDTQLRFRDGWWQRTFTISDPNTVPAAIGPTTSTYLEVSGQSRNTDSSLQGFRCYAGAAQASEGSTESQFGLCRPIQTDNYNLGNTDFRLQHIFMTNDLIVGPAGSSGSANNFYLDGDTGDIFGYGNQSEVHFPNWSITLAALDPGWESHIFPRDDATYDLSCGVGTPAGCPGSGNPRRFRNAEFTGTVTAATFSGAFTASNFATWSGTYATASTAGTAVTAIRSDANLIYPSSVMSTPGLLLWTATDSLGAITMTSTGAIRFVTGSNIQLVDNTAVTGTLGVTSTTNLVTSSGDVVVGRNATIGTSGDLVPNTTNKSQLGTTSKRWADFHTVIGSFTGDLSMGAGTTINADNIVTNSISGPSASFDALTINGAGGLQLTDVSNATVLTVSVEGALPSGGQTLTIDMTDASRTLKLPLKLSNTATIDYGSLAVGRCATVDNAAAAATITVTGAADADACVVGPGNAVMNAAGSTYTCWVSAANTVTIKHCCHDDAAGAGAACNPASGTFRATVLKE